MGFFWREVEIKQAGCICSISNTEKGRITYSITKSELGLCEWIKDDMKSVFIL